MIMTGHGAVAIVTGASSGIGRAFALQLAADGLHVVLVARRRERLEAIVREISSKLHRTAELIVADLADAVDLARVEARILKERSLAVLVNNAGISGQGLFMDSDVATHEAMVKLHITATMRLTHAAVRVMTRRGVIINVSSSAAGRTIPGEVVYCSTKSWINTFTAGVAAELRDHRPDISLQALSPGHTLTEFHGSRPSRFMRYVALKPDEVVRASLLALRTGVVFVTPTCPRHRWMLMAARVASVIPRGIRRRVLHLLERQNRAEPGCGY